MTEHDFLIIGKDTTEAEKLLLRWFEELSEGYLKEVDWSAPGADFLLPQDTAEYIQKKRGL